MRPPHVRLDLRGYWVATWVATPTVSNAGQTRELQALAPLFERTRPVGFAYQGWYKIAPYGFQRSTRRPDQQKFGRSALVEVNWLNWITTRLYHRTDPRTLALSGVAGCCRTCDESSVVVSFGVGFKGCY